MGNPTQEATPHPMRELDNCRVCGGCRGGVPGNGNVIEGLVACDYCYARMPVLPLGLVSARATATHAFALSEQVEFLALKLSEPAADLGSTSDILERMRGLIKSLNELSLAPAQLAWRNLLEYLPEPEAAVLAVSRNGQVRETVGSYLRELAWSAERENEDCNYTHWAPMPDGPSFAPSATVDIDEHLFNNSVLAR